MEPPVEIRDLARSEFARVGEIDRTERIDVLFEQHSTESEQRSTKQFDVEVTEFAVSDQFDARPSGCLAYHIPSYSGRGKGDLGSTRR